MQTHFYALSKERVTGKKAKRGHGRNGGGNTNPPDRGRRYRRGHSRANVTNVASPRTRRTEDRRRAKGERRCSDKMGKPAVAVERRRSSSRLPSVPQAGHARPMTSSHEASCHSRCVRVREYVRQTAAVNALGHTDDDASSSPAPTLRYVTLRPVTESRRPDTVN